MEQTSFSIRGANRAVELGEITVGESPEIVKAEVMTPPGAGEYTVSWVGAALDDRAERGRCTFSVGRARK